MTTNPETVAALREIALELTMQTGEVVTIQLTDWIMDKIIFPDGKILAQLDYRNRWEFSPDRPEGMPNNVSGPNYTNITTSATRSPEAIARDLINRCLPDARAYWQGWQERARKHAAEVAQVNAHCATLEAAGMRRSTHSSSQTRATLYGPGTEADLHDAGLYSFKITKLTIEQAVKILQILNEE